MQKNLIGSLPNIQLVAFWLSLSKRIENFTCDKDLLLEQFENNFKEANETINDNPQEDQLDDDDIQLSDKTVDAAMEYYFSKAPGA